MQPQMTLDDLSQSTHEEDIPLSSTNSATAFAPLKCTFKPT